MLLAGRHRIRLIGICFCAGFLAIAVQLANLTVLQGRLGGHVETELPAIRLARPDIVDRNGVMLATDVAVASLYADPRKIIDVDEAVELLTAAIPELGVKWLRDKLTQQGRAFV